MTSFELPPIILSEYDRLYDLVQNQSNNGRLDPRQVAEFIDKDVSWLLRTTYNGMCPFAFGSDKGVGRGNSCFHTLPFFSFMTQGVLYRPVADRENLQKIIKV